MTRSVRALIRSFVVAPTVLVLFAAAAAAQTTAIHFDSQPGDYIGQGTEHNYAAGTGVTFTATVNYRNGVTVSYQNGFTTWSLEFGAAGNVPLALGAYESARRFAFAPGNALDVHGDGRGCNQVTGRFVVREIQITGTTVTRFAADFEQHCEDLGPGLFGAVRYNSTIATLQPFDGDYPNYELTIAPSPHGRVTAAIVDPAPITPTALDCGAGGTTCALTFPNTAPLRLRLTATPETGYAFVGWSGDCATAHTTIWISLNQREQCAANFQPGVQGTTALFIDSEAGDVVGQGVDRTYTPLDGTFMVSRGYRNGVGLTLAAPNQLGTLWTLGLAATGNQPLAVGSYPAAGRLSSSPLNGLEAYGNSFCSNPAGRFVVREAVYHADGTVLRFAADLEQHCNGAVPALFAAFRYNSTIASLLPFDGDYPKFELTITPPNHGRVSAAGLDCGSGGMTCQLPLASPGDVTLTAMPDAGYVFAGWSDDCRGLAETSVTVNGAKTCTAWFEPQVPSSARSLFYLDSQTGDPLGGGRKEIFSPRNSVWSAYASNGRSLSIQVADATGTWLLTVAAPEGQTLGVGVYNSARGSGPFNRLQVYGLGQSCSSSSVGRFEIFDIAITNGVVERLALDFEQHCSESVPALFGALRFNTTYGNILPFAGDYPRYQLTLSPHAGGVVTGGGLNCGAGAAQCLVTLASPAAVALSATPSSGYIFAGWSGDCVGGAVTSLQVNGPRACAAHFEPLVSAAPRSLYSWDGEAGDYIGGGTDGMLTPASSRWNVTSSDNGRAIQVFIESADTYWRLEFSAPTGQALTTGYYGAARRYPFTPFNGLSATRNSSGCNQLTGRFVVLEVAIAANGTVERFAADFEQHCEDAAPAVFGALRYNATVDSVAPFNGTYPVYELSLVQPIQGGRVTATGLDCGGGAAQCHLVLPAASTIALAATPAFGYTFVGWSEDCSGGTATTLHVNGPKRCGARFEPTIQTGPRTLLRWGSEPNHYIGQGRSEAWSPANSVWTVGPYGGSSGVETRVLSVGPTSDSYWTLRFRAPTGQSLMPGSYTAESSGGSGGPSMEVFGNGRFCSGGVFTVREIVYGPQHAVLSFSVNFTLTCGSASGPLLIGSLQYNSVVDVPPTTVSLDPTVLRFAALHNGSAVTTQPTPQTVRLTLSRANVGWVAASNQPWVQVTPAAGTGSAVVTIAPNLLGGHPGNGSAAATVRFTLTDGTNASQPLTVAVALHQSGTTTAPFGVVDTPLDHRTGVTGAVPMTGWALDDLEVESVTICRGAVAGETAPNDPNCGGAAQIYVGSGVFIEGARPDVQTAHPTHPRSNAGGWGFMILTNMLPDQGNGTFVFTIYARDREGQISVLGTRTMTCANAEASFPFGTIDTPGQGETIRGAAYPNFGWVLTQLPKQIPFDGSTIIVHVDGVALGTASYNHYRADIATLFPGYANSGGAVGFRILDTTTLTNGLHTIVWTARDSGGRTSGLGSRFFRVANGVAGSSTASAAAAMTAESVASLTLDREPIAGRRGWDADAPLRPYPVSSAGRSVLRGEEVDRFELALEPKSGESYHGYLRVGGELMALPVGSLLDAATGRFTWSPGVGFVGAYDLVFVRASGGRPSVRREVRVIIQPKGSGHVGPQVAIDAPRMQQDVAQPFILGGWAADLDAASGTGIDTLHVWAYPLAGGPPIFLGTADYGGARPDVAAVHGDQYRASGFGLTVHGLTPGNYDLAVFPWSSVSGGFAPAQVVRITAR